MATISNKETAILMLLAEQPMHAYQMEKIVENRSMRFWTEISMSSIYKLLNKLAREKLITKRRQEAENGISKNVFALTTKGRAVLTETIAELISEPEHLRWRVDLATSHLSVLPRKRVFECLDQYRDKLEEQLQSYRNLEAYLIEDNCPVYNMALAKRPQFLLEAEIKWLDAYKKELQEKEQWIGK